MWDEVDFWMGVKTLPIFESLYMIYTIMQVLLSDQSKSDYKSESDNHEDDIPSSSDSDNKQVTKKVLGNATITNQSFKMQKIEVSERSDEHQ